MKLLINILTSKDKSSSSSLFNRRRSIDRTQKISTDKNKSLNTVTYRTEVRPKTINPEWNEHFEL